MLHKNSVISAILFSLILSLNISCSKREITPTPIQIVQVEESTHINLLEYKSIAEISTFKGDTPETYLLKKEETLHPNSLFSGEKITYYFSFPEKTNLIGIGEFKVAQGFHSENLKGRFIVSLITNDKQVLFSKEFDDLKGSKKMDFNIKISNMANKAGAIEILFQVNQEQSNMTWIE